MDARTRVLVVDYGLALGAVGLGALATSSLSTAVAALVVLGCSAMVGALALAELTATLAWLEARRPTSLFVVAAALFAVALALVVGRLAVPTPSGPLLAGMGVGLAGYRTVYGLLGPVPPSRLAVADRASRGRGVD